MRYAIHCCQCDKKVNGVLVTGKSVYPHRRDLASLRFIKCPTCLSFVGVHKNSPQDKPKAFGCIPTEELKQHRRALHDLIDPIWKSRKLTRTQTYTEISKELGFEFHAGETRTVEDVAKVTEAVERLKKRLAE